MFKKNTLATAVRVALMLSAATMMHGCVGDGDETTTNNTKVGGTYASVTAPKGTVMGVVQDTNGNPLVGATVYLGAKKTTTNAGGQYQFNDVAVVSTTSLDGVQTQAIQISIIPPAPAAGQAGYLGATVTVTPQAQIDEQGNSTATTGDQTANQVTTFISGYSASAGTAVLPKLDATVQGTLRDAATGELITNHSIALDMVAVNGVNQEQQQNGVTTSYATIPFATVSGADGNFTLTGVPNDSDLRFVVGGYSVTAVDANSSLAGKGVTTDDEVDEIVVGNVRAQLITALDDIDPYVISVDGLAANNMFAKDVDGTTGVTINFSEVMTGAGTDVAMYVRDTTNNVYVPVVGGVGTIAADGKSVTFTTSEPFQSGANLKIYIAQGDLHDLAGNLITDVPAGITDPFTYDVDQDASAVGTVYLRLDMQAWGNTNTNALAVTNTAQEETDAFGLQDDMAAVQSLNPAFNDVWDADAATNVFQQMNSADNDDNVSGSDAAERLSALASAIAGQAVVVDTDNAQVTFTSSGASYYTFVVTRLNAPHSVSLDIVTPNMETDGTTDADGNLKYFVTEEGQVAIVLGDVNPGDMLTITPYDDFGFSGTAVAVTLQDNVEPTTVLQNSYGLGTLDSGISSDFGNGGELTQPGGITNGTPYLNITMGLLDNINTSGANLPLGDDVLQDELLDYNTVDAASGLPYITTPGVYDATAYAAFASHLSRTIGIAFSEDIVLTGTAPSYNGTAGLLGGWTAHNDVFVTDNGSTVNADLVNVDVANIMTLANTDHDKVIDLSNVVTDAAATPNVGSNAKVIVRDLMPPMVTSGVYQGDRLTLTFNESIAPKVGDTLLISNANGSVTYPITLSQTTVSAFNAQADKTTLRILDEDWGGDINWAATFNVGTYDEGAITSATHGIVVYSNIEDLQGNDMATVNAGVAPVNFAFYNAVGLMALESETPAGFVTTNVAGVFTVTYKSNHAIDLVASFGAASATQLSASEITASFPATLAAATIVNSSATYGVLSADGKTLTLNISFTGNLTSGDKFGVNVGMTSDYDGNQTLTTNGITAP
ncbi:MAG TPA: Ig-like domain-containing protein [Gammaproteobacteria bacterium]